MKRKVNFELPTFHHSCNMVNLLWLCLTTVFFTTILNNAITRASIIYAKSGDDVEFSFQFCQAMNVDFFHRHTHTVNAERRYKEDFLRITFFQDLYGGGTVILRVHYYNEKGLFGYAWEEAWKKKISTSSYGAYGGFHFSLNNVSLNDAGKYVCNNDFDWQMEHNNILFVVEAPVNASIAVEEPLIAGHDVKLRCLATSLTRPNTYRRAMKFRWYEFTQGLNDTQEQWTEIKEGIENDDEDIETDGSGWEERKVTKGRYADPLHKVLEISPLSRKDHGRRITCSAMEDFNLWSDMSPELVLSVHWKPIHSDLTLVPNLTHYILVEGDSIDVICMATCLPACNVTWEKVHAGNETVTLTENSTLSLHQVSHPSHGVYRCRGSNLYGSAHVHWKLSVTQANKHWLSKWSHRITVVAIVIVVLAFGIVATTVLVLRYRKRRSFAFWSHWRLSSGSESVPSLSDPKETADSS